jgi:hypothetical protein
VCGAFGTFAHRACAARLLGPVTSNVRHSKYQYMNSARFGNSGKDTRSGQVSENARSGRGGRVLLRSRFSRIAAKKTRSVTRGEGLHFSLAVRGAFIFPASQVPIAFVRHASAPPLETNSLCRLVVARSVEYKAVPNRSVNRTRYGRRRKAGAQRLRHCRAPALRRLPPRAGYLER